MASGDPVLYLSNPPGVQSQTRRRFLDDLARLNELTGSEYGDPETSTRISQYEMAYRMQTSVPELNDLSDESQATLDRYGPDVQRPVLLLEIAFLPDDSRRETFDLSSCSIEDGISILVCRAGYEIKHVMWISRKQPWSKI